MGKRAATQPESGVQRKKIRQSTQNNSSNDDQIAGPSSQSPVNRLSTAGVEDARSGKILTVKLKNFMCHRNITVDFNPHTNLLVGQNGSGKSAILTALIVGLGSKANATNRCNNIKQLIRTGESSATIEVHISNNGSDAYEHAKFGDKIIVIRQISASGSSTYKLKNAMGNTMSSSRADLLRMILYMNIQVDNPVCVMTQDASRGFLRDSDPKKRYQLFMKATQLDVVIEKLNGCIQQLSNAKTKYDAQQKLQESLELTKRKAEQKLNQFRSMEPLKMEIKRYKAELHWLAVVNQEELMRDMKLTLDETRKKSNELIAKLAKVGENERQMTDKMTELSAEIASFNQQSLTSQQAYDEERNNFRVQNDRFLEKDRNLKKLAATMARIEHDIQKLEEAIREESMANKHHIEELKRENEQKLAEKQDTEREMLAAIANHKHEFEMFCSASTQFQTQYDELNGRRHMKQTSKQNIEMQLKQIHAPAREYLPQFGDHIPKLVETIEKYYKSGKFAMKPIGPIGNFIEVKGSKYRPYVEDSLTKVLHSFCVDNHNDLKTLRDLQKKHFPGAKQVSVITSKFSSKVYDVRPKMVQSDDKTVRLMDLIVVDEPVIMNCLIDQLSIETVLYTENGEHAMRITCKKENVPRNLSHVILLNPYNMFFPAPVYRSYTKKPTQTRLLRLNGADRERAYNAELALITDELSKITREMTTIENKRKENQQMMANGRKNMTNMETKLKILKLEINDLEAVEYPQENDISVMQQEVVEQTKQLERINSEYMAAQTDVHESKQSVARLEARVKELLQNIRIGKSQMEAKQKEIDDINEKLKQRESQQGHYQKKIQTFAQLIEKLTKELNDSTTKLLRLEAMAKKSGERVDVEHTEEQLNTLIKSNERKINNVHASKETLESVQASYEKADEELKMNGEMLRVLVQALKMLKISVRNRFSNVMQLKTFMMTRMKYRFSDVMELRNCRGSLEFDTNASTLEIKVVPRDKQNENAVSKTTNLSGGERSYATVAFLMSLWSCVDHPFYFLDEYDVFTDQVNRTFMTRLLLNEAEKKAHYQYTFLTPQDTSEIKRSDILSILRLENPDR